MMRHEEYFATIRKNLFVAYALAQRCREKGYDPERRVETLLAQNMIERVVGLVSVLAPQITGVGVVERIRELEQLYGAQDWRVALVIALEVARETFCTFRDKLEAMEVGIRVGIAYVTNGVVSSPLEGFTGIKVRKRHDGKDYFALCFSGPIRSAGGTGASVSVLIGDYVRVHMGYEVYDPSEEEIQRMVTELYDYHDRVTNLQYLPSEEEIRFMVRHLPVQVDGDPSEKFDVSNYKGLSRIETDRIRNGPCLTIGEGLCQKAPKLLRNLLKWGEDMGKGHWAFLEEFLHLQKRIKSKQQGVVLQSDQKIKPDFTFVKDLVAGRPVFTHPLARGGFRLRYGRCRTSGFSCQAVHPATMIIVNKFIAIGTQLKVERPGKSAVVASCDTVEGPIVKLKNGDVLLVENALEARRVLPEVEEILYLGDLLINYGDFFNRNHLLVPVGYCEEWWALELRKAVEGKDLGEFREAVEQLFLSSFVKIDAALAIALTSAFGVPFHPRYTFRWSDITREDFLSLLQWFGQANIEEQKIIFSLVGKHTCKRVLELLGVPHRCVAQEYAVVEGEWAVALRFSLEHVNLQAPTVLEMLHQGIVFRDKSGTSIGARMGRPEKAKMRKLIGSPHILFPVGDEGGRMRCFESVLNHGFVLAQFPLFHCRVCDTETVYGACERCGKATVRKYFCQKCNRVSFEQCHSVAVPYRMQKIDVQHYFTSALKTLQLRTAPTLIKGVRGTSNRDHVLEHLAKGILRAHYNLYVNKDGTIRYDMTEMPLTHFKPREIMTSVEVLRSLGYTRDIFGKELMDHDQILELKIQDVILPCSEESLEEGAKTVLFKTTKFVDDLLVSLYKEQPFYNLQRPEDVVGHYIVGLAPHISAGIVGRVIGFSKTQGFLAHPCFHSIMRRDCVYPTTKLFFFDQNGGVHYEKIGEVVENLLQRGCPSKVIDVVGTRSVVPDQAYYTYGADPETKALVKRQIKYFIKGPREQHWIKITTATNRTLMMTFNHEFMYLDAMNAVRFKKAEDIVAGDKLLVMDSLDLEEKQPKRFDLLKEFIEHLPSDVKSRVYLVHCEHILRSVVQRVGKRMIASVLQRTPYSMSTWHRSLPLRDIERLLEYGILSYEDIPDTIGFRSWFSRLVIPRYLMVDRELCRLLGYYTAEGHCRENKTTRQVSWRICNNVLIPVVSNLIRTTFGIEPLYAENKTKITIAHSLVYYLFKYVFDVGLVAKTKKVPPFLYRVSDELVLEYLSAYVDGDASIVPERMAVQMYSVNRSLLDDLALLLSRFSLIGCFVTTKKRLHGRTILERYKELGKKPKWFQLHHLVFIGEDGVDLAQKLRLYHPAKNQKAQLVAAHTMKTERVLKLQQRSVPLHSFGDAFIDYVKKVEVVHKEAHSYCVEVEWRRKEERSVLWGEQIINTRCDGDESTFMLLMDMLLNFSRRYLPDHRGATQDAPLVLTSVILPQEVDDMVFDMDVAWQYPLELYEAAQQYKHPSEVKIEQLRSRLGTPGAYERYGFTHPVDDLNEGVLYSAYKSLPTMSEKVLQQMDLANKIRAVDSSDVAKQVIERHFIRDIRGNLRKFSMQQFRCVKCNEKYRRPPLVGRCLKCQGNIIFTVAEGSIMKYLEPSLQLAEKYQLPVYLRQSLEITKRRIESIFGKQADKQVGLGKWFG